MGTITDHSYRINNYNDNIIIATITAASATTIIITILQLPLLLPLS